ncbi:TetR/AcrR family transcriptional regulator [Devosia sp. FKR38]|uniref:TetR/AcrR family transcriptional regulator n=1 Tax=Devosia sp. FKR38 TaxID=2562312 RepID=UPI0010BF8113|nr:TetR/AcrR family transcriptional regulator [Devosia sp. FKR38]
MSSDSPLYDAAPTTSIREAQKELTRQRIIDAAFVLFQQLGFRSTTIDKIVKRAHVNRTTFYLHFKDKIDVAIAIGRRQAPGFVAEFDRLISLKPASRAAVQQWVKEFLTLSGKEDLKLVNYVLSEATLAEPTFAVEYSTFLKRLGKRLIRQSVGSLSVEAKDHRAAEFISAAILMNKYTTHTSLQDVAFFGPGFEDVIAGMLLRALFTPEA